MIDRIVISKLSANQTKTGLLETKLGKMQVGIHEVDERNKTVKYFTTEGLRKLYPEINKPAAERDNKKIREIEDDPNNYGAVSFDDIIDFIPINATR